MYVNLFHDRFYLLGDDTCEIYTLAALSLEVAIYSGNYI